MKEKRKILFLTDNLGIGGVEKSLLELIKHLYNNFDITVAVIHKDGDLKSKFQKYANIVEISNDKSTFSEKIIDKIKRKKIFDAFKMFQSFFKSKKKISYIRQCTNRIYELDNLEEMFDYAVCYHKPTDILLPYTAFRIKAKNKFLWIHTELLGTVEEDIDYYKYLYGKYDKFICVSNSVNSQLQNILNNRKKDIITIYNLLNIDEITKKATEIPIEFSNSRLKILTVGRLSYEKGQDLSLKTAKLLKQKKLDFIWFFIGDGPSKEYLKHLTEQLNLKKNIIFLGAKDNPYPYMKYCDIYVQPSREEGYGMTIAEAKLFKCSIVLTNFLTASEHIIDNVNGFISDFDEDKLCKKILNLASDEKLRKLFSNSLSVTCFYLDSKNKINNLFDLEKEESN